jgi:hypothetical protein
MTKRLLSLAALLLLAGGAHAAPITYTLSSVLYFNSFAPTPTAVANCTGCGTATAVWDGNAGGSVTMTGVSWYFNAGGNEYNIAFDGSTTMALGTSLTKTAGPGTSCVDIVGFVCDTSDLPYQWLSGMGWLNYYTGVGSDGTTNCANDRCRVNVIINTSGNLQVTIRRALSESVGSTNSQTYRMIFTPNAVPVPAAVWLFGSALGLLGVIRHRRPG